MDDNIKEFITLVMREYGATDKRLKSIASQAYMNSNTILFEWYCCHRRGRNWFDLCPKPSCQICWICAIQGIKEEMEGFKHDDRQVCRKVDS